MGEQENCVIIIHVNCAVWITTLCKQSLTLSCISIARWVVLPPGAAHKSNTFSSGLGSRTCETTIEGKFWTNTELVNWSFIDGATYKGHVIRMAIPLHVDKMIQKKLQQNTSPMLIPVCSWQSKKLMSTQTCHSHTHKPAVSMKWNC